ncbi:MAG: EamA family transporter [Cellvibrionaceae bacterium]
MSYLQFFVILITVFMSACAQLLLKLGMNKVEEKGGLFEHGIMSLVQAVFSPLVFSGIFVYGISVLVWLWVLSKVDLSIAYPFVGVSFIFTLLFGVFLLDESLNVYKIIGTLMIAFGCFFIVKSA